MDTDLLTAPELSFTGLVAGATDIVHIRQGSRDFLIAPDRNAGIAIIELGDGGNLSGPAPLGAMPESIAAGPLKTSTRSRNSVGTWAPGSMPYMPLKASSEELTSKPRMVMFSALCPSLVVKRTEGSLRSTSPTRLGSRSR